MKDLYTTRAAQLAGAFFSLLWLLILLFALAPVLDEGTGGPIALNLLFYAAMLTAIRASVRGRQVLLVALAVSLFAWVTDAASEILDIDALGVPAAIVNPGLVVIAMMTVLARVVRDERVIMNTVYGAVCGYFLLGLFWAFIFYRIEQMEPGSFALAGDSGEGLFDFLYFSFVTQTTLGFGDITPVAAFPRSLAALEAFIGQVYLVVMVARLVALQVAHSGRAEEARSGARASRRSGASREPTSGEDPDP